MGHANGSDRGERTAGVQVVEVVGVGASGLESLDAAGLRLVEDAEVVIGGERHLAMLESRPDRRLVPWPSPLLPQLHALFDEVGSVRVVVLASGDPLVSGIGSTLVRALGAEAVRIHPAVSSVALARARMGWATEESEVVTLVGRDVDRLRRDLAPRARLVVLTSGEDAPDRVAALLVEEGYAGSRLTVLGDLGTPAESRVDGVAASWAGGAAPRLHLVCVECRPIPAAARGRSCRDWATRHTTTTGSSPSGSCERPPWRTWRRSRGTSCGTSAPAPARSASSSPGTTRATRSMPSSATRTAPNG